MVHGPFHHVTQNEKEMCAMCSQRTETKEYAELIAAGSQGLAENEFWCILDPGGDPMADTASKRLDTPVITFCDALQCDWDDATETGYRLGRAVFLPQ